MAASKTGGVPRAVRERSISVPPLLGIGYRSQRESRWSRTISRMQKLRARLGGSANLLEPFPLRPRYMRHRTYQTLNARYMSLSRQNTADLQGFVSRLKRRIGAAT